MNKKETLETLGTYIVWAGLLLPIFFDGMATIIWMGLIGIGFGILVWSGIKFKKEN